ncbi:hypothetical protein [Antribacter gilvus]|uniref:hypothetical protein n=1 Tax=Antribacter gilvus TaxID=2304675 RepID=UPI000F784896|nr:hypothetical protein [Antribacter gilvus]
MDDHGTSSDDAFDPADSLRVIREQTDRAREATEPDGRVMFGAWGLAWLVGYLAMWTSARETGAPEPWAGFVLAGTIVGATALTIVHSTTRASGVRGASARVGAMYGWTWFLGFTVYGMVLGAMFRAGASWEVVATAANGFACLIVGLMYIAGGLLFGEIRMYAVGAWMLVTAAVAAFAGMPHTYLVMALAGGGGFLVMVVVEQVIRARRRGLAPAGPPATSPPATGGGSSD